MAINELDFRSIIKNEIQNALNYYDTEFSQERIDAMGFYLGEPFGNEVEGRSQVVATEVSDVIEYIMPSLTKIFAQSGQYARFVGRQPEDVQAAEQATELVNFVINNDNNGFRVVHDFMKDALLFKMGAVKFYYDETEKTEEEEYEGLTEDELALLVADPNIEVIEQEAIEMGMTAPDGTEIPVSVTYNVKVKKTEMSGKVKLLNIPPEELIYNRRATSLEDCSFIAHRSQVTVSDLVAMGYEREMVEQYAGYNDLDNDQERQRRFEDLEDGPEIDSSDPSMREVLVTEGYIYADYDDDGIAELRRFVALGDGAEIVENEPWDVIPFALLSPVLMPHRMVGRSVAEMVMDLQLIKSTILRQMLDNLYLSNNSRVVAVEGQVNLDDLLTSRPGGIVRSRAPGMVQPLSVPQIGAQAFQMLGYIDEVRDQRTGFSKASMGLDPSTLQSTTAAAVNATIQGAQAKIEMIARVFAETGMKDLAKGVLHLCQKHMNKERTIRIRNEYIPIDPRAWDNEFDIEVTVGLGTGNEDQKTAMMLQVSAKQEQILQQLGPNNPIVNITQYVNTLKKIAETAGFRDTDQFFNSGPEVEQAMAAQAQQAQQPQVNAEVELERQKMEMQVQLQREKAAAELQLQREKFKAELELRRRELELELQLRQQKMAMGGSISENLPRV
jgi:hypothetical protein